jgi:cyclophilin family peptidyl-prolyl cis-trans isomerase
MARWYIITDLTLRHSLIDVPLYFNLILGKHTIFGRIHSGMKIIQRIGSIATDPQDKPLDEIRITRVRSRDAVDRLLM